MSTVKLSPNQWSKIYKYLDERPDVYAGKEAECRLFIEAVLWMARRGAQWRLLPSKYGKWNSVYKRFARWCDKGVWERMHQHFVHDPDMENLMVDSTVIRAHPCAAGASKKTVVSPPRLWGVAGEDSSRKVHVSVEALGNPLRFTLTAGQSHDLTQAEALITDYNCEHVIADRAYDSDKFLGAIAVIPPRSNRKSPRSYDAHLYRERHLVECFMGKIKHYRRIFSRYDKLDRSYLGFLHFVGALIWLR